MCCASVTRGFCCVWSEQLDADDWLNPWPDGGGGQGSKLVKSNLPRSKFPFILGGEGGSKLDKSNLPRSKFPFILGGGGLFGQVKSVIKKIF